MEKSFEIYDALEVSGITVHFPNKKKGVCEEPYAVVKEMGRYSPNGVTGRGIVHLLLYAPETNYEALIAFRKQVKGVIDGLSDVHRTGLETPIVYEDAIKAYSTSIEYKFFSRVK